MTAKKAKRRTRTPSRSKERGSGTPVARADAEREEARHSRREEARRYRESIRRKAVRRRSLRRAAFGLIAVAAVGLDQAIANLPKGLHHQLGDGGTGLSGGERRRLGIARLLVASPDVYVFDEATEGLDAASAALVIENIRFETRGRAVLLATHHRDEADNADTLLWIEKGKLTQIARRGEAAFDAMLDQLNPRSCRRLDPGRISR